MLVISQNSAFYFTFTFFFVFLFYIINMSSILGLITYLDDNQVI